MKPSPLWSIDFSEEAKSYFLDNLPYVKEFFAELFRLTYYTDPLEGCVQVEGNPVIYALAAMDHTVMFTFEGGLIYVLAVRPD